MYFFEHIWIVYIYQELLKIFEILIIIKHRICPFFSRHTKYRTIFMPDFPDFLENFENRKVLLVKLMLLKLCAVLISVVYSVYCNNSYYLLYGSYNSLKCG